MPTPQGRYWLITLSCEHHPQEPTLHEDFAYIKGQKEIGQGGFEHWQFLVNCKRVRSRNQVKAAIHPTAHVELTRSTAANQYVWKDESAVPNTRFEYGEKTFNRNSKTDWAQVKQHAIQGNLDQVPDDIYIRHYASLVRIRSDHARPAQRDAVQVRVYWGPPGTGKSYRAIEEAKAYGTVYFKNPRTKWWDGYRGEQNVVIDEFSGDAIDVDYIKRWWDIYPCSVEIKGSSVPLHATRFWVTSNHAPDYWFPNARPVDHAAIRRRITTVEEMTQEYVSGDDVLSSLLLA